MVADVADVRHRPDQAEMLGQRGQARMQLADAHAGDRRGDRLVGAANLRRRLGLQVPGIEVAGPAAQQDEDARLLGGTAAKSSIAIDARGNHPRQAQVKAPIPPAWSSRRREITADRCRLSLSDGFISASPEHEWWLSQDPTLTERFRSWQVRGALLGKTFSAKDARAPMRPAHEVTTSSELDVQGGLGHDRSGSLIGRGAKREDLTTDQTPVGRCLGGSPWRGPSPRGSPAGPRSSEVLGLAALSVVFCPFLMGRPVCPRRADR